MKTLNDYLSDYENLKLKKIKLETSFKNSENYTTLNNAQNEVYDSLKNEIINQLNAQKIEDRIFSEYDYLSQNDIYGVDYQIDSDKFTLFNQKIDEKFLKDNPIILEILKYEIFDLGFNFQYENNCYPVFVASTYNDAFITHDNYYVNLEDNFRQELNRDYSFEHGLLLHEKHCNNIGCFNGLYNSDYYGNPSEIKSSELSQKFRDKLENVELFLEIIDAHDDFCSHTIYLDEYRFYDYLNLSNEFTYEIESFEIEKFDVENAILQLNISYSYENENDEIITKSLTKEIKL